MKRCLICNLILLSTIAFCIEIKGQGLARNWLHGYTIGTDQYAPYRRGMISSDSNSVTVEPDSFKMAFRASQATISDESGNLRIATNGCWIADATGDTMMNGSGLNPNSFTSAWCGNNSAIPFANTSLLLPMPGDSSRFVLIHQTGNYSQVNSMSTELYYSVIDMNLNGGLGGVIQKNVILIQDILNHGIAAVRHANGRDWWIVAFKESSSKIYKILLTPLGFLTISLQTLNYSPHLYYSGSPVFSGDGNKFAYFHYSGTWNNITNSIRVMDFDRCSGMLSNFDSVTQVDSMPGLSLSFSPNSKYLYWATFHKIFQLNTDTSDIVASQQLVAVNDGYCFPFSFLCTDFWMMYLAANGKIYISSGSSVIDLHYIEYPDIAGVACGVQQHALHLPCYSARGHVNHPNYYLGPVAGSVCDSLGVGISELERVRNFKLHPNPVKNGGTIEVTYLLPQNKPGVLELTDMTGRKVFTQFLPPWSTMQNIPLPALSVGFYLCSIRSGGSQMTVKVVVN